MSVLRVAVIAAAFILEAIGLVAPWSALLPVQQSSTLTASQPPAEWPLDPYAGARPAQRDGSALQSAAPAIGEQTCYRYCETP